jgi:hypothetical protein
MRTSRTTTGANWQITAAKNSRDLRGTELLPGAHRRNDVLQDCLFAHVLFGKPVSTFPGHAVMLRQWMTMRIS